MGSPDAGALDSGVDALLAIADAGVDLGVDAPCVDLDGDAVCATFDCDDDDARRFPGNAEICDAEALDEDCNPTTFGTLDADGDGAIANACCNGDACGLDCDDSNASIGVGFVDGPPVGCDLLDNDCDGVVDPGCACVGSEARACGATDVGVCAFGRTTCASGAWGSCLGAVSAGPTERCNGLDDDCDGASDEGYPCALGQSRGCDTPSGARGVQVCDADCTRYGPCATAADEGPTVPGTCNGDDDDGDGAVDENFDCRLGVREPCTTRCGVSSERSCADGCRWGSCEISGEVCNFCDDNGVGGLLDEVVLATSVNLDQWECGMGRVVGAAECEVVDRSSSFGVVEEFTRVVRASDGRNTGAVWLSDATAQVGWGAVDFQLDVTSRYCGTGSPDGGWALVLSRTSGSDRGTADARGVPYDRSGLAVVWGYSARVPGPGGARAPEDRVEVVRLDGSGGAFGRALGTGGAGDSGVIVPIGYRLSGPAATCTSVRQPLFITYVPDDPLVGGSQERLDVRFERGGTLLARYLPDIDPGDGVVGLEDDLPSGTRLSIAITAGNPSVGGAVDVDVKMWTRVFGSFGAVTRIDNSFASRARVCP